MTKEAEQLLIDYSKDMGKTMEYCKENYSSIFLQEGENIINFTKIKGIISVER